MLILHEDVFYAHFKPYRHPRARHDLWGGHGLETFDEDFALVRSLDIRHVWTVVEDCAGDDLWITPGVRLVNRVCYLVTEMPHNNLDVDFHCPNDDRSLMPVDFQRQVLELRQALQLSSR
jgi:hypothetical protein